MLLIAEDGEQLGYVKILRDRSAQHEAAAAHQADAEFLRSVLAAWGDCINAVAPSPIWTPLNPCGGADKENIAHFGEKTPMKRAGQPNEVTPAFPFLACEDASYMPGQVLHPTGGTVVNG